MMRDTVFTVDYNKIVTKGVHEIRLISERRLPVLHCGQFLHLEVPGLASVLRRPFCLYKFDAQSVTIVVAVVGRGTELLCKARPGDRMRAILPLGNGFVLGREHKRIALIGGGVGCAPLAAVGLCYPDRQYRAYLGFSGKDKICLTEDFAFADTTVCTDDGSVGYKGYPTDACKADMADFKPDVLLVCGADGLIKAAARLSLSTGVPGYVSTESRMGCGVGACLVCACAVKNPDGSVSNKRACADGPVFSLEELVL